MRIKRIALTSCTILMMVIMMFTLTSCNKLKKYNKMIMNSTSSVASLELDIQMLDQSILVYEYNNKTTINGTSASVVITLSSLNENFELETTQQTEEVANMNRDDLFKINLDSKNLASFTKEKDVITCEVSKANLTTVLTNCDASLDLATNASLVLTFADKKLTKVTCTYQTTTNKTVVINATYTY